MTDTDRDFLMWKNGRGRYAAGMKHYGAKSPQEGGVFSSLYSGAVNASRPQASCSSYNGAEPVKAEPEALEADTMPYCPPRMERIPGENAPDEAQAVQDFPEMEPETEAEPARAYFYKMDERSGIIR